MCCEAPETQEERIPSLWKNERVQEKLWQTDGNLMLQGNINV